MLPFAEELSQTAWISDHALDFLACADPERPFFAHISYVQPHAPSCPPAEYMERIDRSHIPEPVPPEWEDDPLAPHCFAQGGFRGDTAVWRDRRHYYLADVSHLDHQLGLVLDALEDSGRWEETVLIFLSDHGDLLYDHGFFGKGERHYDACVRIPLVVAGAGLRQGLKCDALVQLEDIMPTVLELAGLPQPQLPKSGTHFLEGTQSALPGASLLPWCRGEQPSDWRDAVYIESYNNTNSRTPQNWARTIRTHEWRYTLYPGGAGEQLFHISDDADETRNLAGDASKAKIRGAMRDRLLEAVILQDYPHPPRDLFALGVH
ncbi:MAG: sulfatase-like hydrolase/transferase [Caldilineaceae bacterium]|nr:sulfatase-like hydrolase/transferase [Caldilineaceae bacterium]